MPRHSGSTRRTEHRNKRLGHRMHRRPRLVRVKARTGRLRTPVGWSPSMRWDDALGRWVI